VFFGGGRSTLRKAQLQPDQLAVESARLDGRRRVAPLPQPHPGGDRAVVF